MPEVNLSTLRDRELRQLLDSARQRGQASLSYMILQEMEARRTNGGREAGSRRSSARRPAEPRVVAVDLGDPLERRDEFSEDDWDDPAVAQPLLQGEPAATAAEEPPLRMERSQAPGRPPPPPPKARSRSRSGWGALLFACGLALGLAGGWKAAEYAYAPRLAKVAAADQQPAPPVQAAPAAAAPAAAPEAAVPEAPLPPVDTTAEAAPPAAQPAPETPAPAPTPPPPAAEPEQVAPAAVAEAAPKASHCAAELKPADRTICGDPKLQRLQRELRQAYAEALEAHEDRDLLRQRQLAWADARDTVTDPDRLARLYEERIRKLNAATAEALRQK